MNAYSYFVQLQFYMLLMDVCVFVCLFIYSEVDVHAWSSEQNSVMSPLFIHYIPKHEVYSRK